MLVHGRGGGVVGVVVIWEYNFQVMWGTVLGMAVDTYGNVMGLEEGQQ